MTKAKKRKAKEKRWKRQAAARRRRAGITVESVEPVDMNVSVEIQVEESEVPFPEVTSDLSSLSKTALYKLACERGIKGRSKMDKPALIEALS
jgi:hypothetical protein